jgi:hypothetical protein
MPSRRQNRPRKARKSTEMGDLLDADTWFRGPAPGLCPECGSANIRKRADGSWHCERCRERELELEKAPT